MKRTKKKENYGLGPKSFRPLMTSLMTLFSLMKVVYYFISIIFIESSNDMHYPILSLRNKFHTVHESSITEVVF